MTEPLTPAEIADILLATSNLPCAEKVVALVDQYQQLSDKLSETVSAKSGPAESAVAEEYVAIGWLHKVIVDKRVNGGARDGQIQIGGVWGRPSDHLYFTVERALDRYVWWEAPVYVKATGLSDAATDPKADNGGSKEKP